MEALPSSSSVARTPALVNTSSSGSIHNRLVISNSSSARRLRAQSVVESDDEKLAVDSVNPKAIVANLSPNLGSPTLPLYDASRGITPQRHNIFYWILLTYGILSMGFFTTRIFSLGIARLLQHNNSWVASLKSPISPINDFPTSYRLSKLLSLKPDPKSFRPFMVKNSGITNVSDVTACFWITDGELQVLERWSTSWKGPVSLVVSTNNTPEIIFAKLKSFNHAPWLTGNMTVHIVQKSWETTDPSNSYLNIARMLAHTRYVLLFPSSPQTHFPATLYNQTISKITSNSTTLKHPYLIVPEKLTPHTPFPFHTSPPLLLEQSHPIWCSERFFTAPSREDDWEECLWQFWLHSHGSLRSLVIPSWKNPPSKVSPHGGTTLSINKHIHQRLTSRFRHETCVLAAKKLKDKAEGGKMDARKAQWLRKICRPVECIHPFKDVNIANLAITCILLDYE